MTDERIVFHATASSALSEPSVLPNLRWLIPMAMSLDDGESADSFCVQEIAPVLP